MISDELIEASNELTTASLLAFLRKKPMTVDVSILRDSFGGSSASIERMLSSMVKKGDLVKEKRGRKFVYRLGS